MIKRIWLTWEIQRRNRTMSDQLNAELYEITTDGSRWKRYPILTLKTLVVIFKNKPTLLFVQNPSLLLTAIAVISGKFFRTTVVVDVHNAGIFPLEGKSKILNLVAKTINSYSDKVIVSNSSLIKFIKKNKNDVFVIPDPIPIIKKHSEFPIIRGKFSLVFVCSWAADEPYEEVLKIAENLSNVANIYITGNSKNKVKDIINILPENLILTGFLSNSEYEDLIHACDALMILTKRDNCLVCGAYEGVAVEKPMVLSKTDALVNHFNKGCIYTDNSSSDIELSVRKLIEKYDYLALEIKSLKQEQEHKVGVDLYNFKEIVQNSVSK